MIIKIGLKLINSSYQKLIKKKEEFFSINQVQMNSLTKGKNHLSHILLPIAMLCGAPVFPANTLTLVCEPPSTDVTVPLFSVK